MRRLSLEQAYPGIAFRGRTRNWWARLTHVPPECVHLETDQLWMATLVPDSIFLQGKPVAQRQPERPEVSLCRNCLITLLAAELPGYSGAVVAFEPDGTSLTQYFFVDAVDFAAAGLEVAVAQAIQCRLASLAGSCEKCSEAAKWLWLGHNEVASLDEVAQIAQARGRCLCPGHGAQALCACLEELEAVNLFYMNLPYGKAGAYLWI